MMKKIVSLKKILIFLLLFLFFLGWNIIVQPLNLDEVWNYGFSHSIYKGLIPYKDFNMVITPLYPFIMSLFFHIFSSNILVFHIINSLMLTIMFFIIKKIVKSNEIIILLLFCFPISIIYPSYNLFLLFLFILLIYFEDKNDYIVGLLIASMILTKQSVGVFFLIPSLIYGKDKKKLLRRYGSCLLGLSIFLISLIVFHNFKEFIDLCFLGLFDFAAGNGNFNIFVILTIGLIIIVILLIRKKRSIDYYYVICFSSLCLPLFDLYHFALLLSAFLVVLFKNYEINFKINIKLFVVGILIFLCYFYLRGQVSGGVIYPNKINKFQYRLIPKSYINYSNKINNYMDKNKDKKIIFIAADSYYYRLIRDENIGYLDLINTGNFGYNGSNKLLKKIKSCHNCLFLVNKEEIGKIKQTDQRVIKYIIKYGNKIDKIINYDVYTLK